MLAKLRPRSAYDVMAALALFVALSTGGAYAANTVFSTDIVDGEVKTPDLADAAVTRNKLASTSVTNGKISNSAVTGAKVADDSLTGVDVDESMLGKVPDADRLDGKDWTQFLSTHHVVGRGTVMNAGEPDEFWFSVFGAQIWVGCSATQTEVKYRAAVSNLVVWRDNGGGDAEVFRPAVGAFIPDAVNGNADTLGEMLTFVTNHEHVIFVAAVRETAPNPDVCRYQALTILR